jgi:hypothetical protein
LLRHTPDGKVISRTFTLTPNTTQHLYPPQNYFSNNTPFNQQDYRHSYAHPNQFNYADSNQFRHSSPMYNTQAPQAEYTREFTDTEQNALKAAKKNGFYLLSEYAKLKGIEDVTWGNFEAAKRFVNQNGTWVQTIVAGRILVKHKDAKINDPSYFLIENNKPNIAVTFNASKGELTIENPLVPLNDEKNKQLTVIGTHSLLTPDENSIPEEMKASIEKLKEDGFVIVEWVQHEDDGTLADDSQWEPSQKKTPQHFITLFNKNTDETVKLASVPLALPAPNSDKQLDAYGKPKPIFTRDITTTYQEGFEPQRKIVITANCEEGKKLMVERAEVLQQLLLSGNSNNNRGLLENNNQRPVPKSPVVVPVNIVKVEEEKKAQEPIDPNAEFLLSVIAALNDRYNKLQEEYHAQSALMRFLFGGKKAKLDGVNKIFTALTVLDDNNNNSSIKPGLKVIDVINAIEAERKTNADLNKSHFGSRTVDMLDEIMAQAKVRAAADYAKQAIVKRTTELEDEARKPGCLNLYATRKANKITNLNLLKAAITDDMTPENIQAAIKQMDPKAVYQLNQGVIQHKTQDLLNELSNLKKTAEVASSKNHTKHGKRLKG